MLWPIINLRVVIGLLAFISTLMFYLSHYHVFRTMAMRRNNNKRTRSLTTNITFEQQCINQKHRNRANQKHRRHHLQLRPPNAQGERKWPWKVDLAKRKCSRRKALKVLYSAILTQSCKTVSC